MLREVWMVFTEVNGYRNFYGNMAYTHKEKAERVRDGVIAKGKHDDAYVVGFILDENRG